MNVGELMRGRFGRACLPHARGVLTPQRRRRQSARPQRMVTPCRSQDAGQAPAGRRRGQSAPPSGQTCVESPKSATSSAHDCPGDAVTPAVATRARRRPGKTTRAPRAPDRGGGPGAVAMCAVEWPRKRGLFPGPSTPPLLAGRWPRRGPSLSVWRQAGAVTAVHLVDESAGTLYT